ncbi:hypothetical protein [Nocardiopsis sp. LOL_012]|uniref:hypothetical protein n=1 Tax=Nocardiopsis sp. LOL_012 TaxID=3345409 RepID=UPI003A85CA21
MPGCGVRGERGLVGFAQPGDQPAHGLQRARARGLDLRKRRAHRRRVAFDDVARTGIIYEGYGVDHAHAKLVPMHGTAGNAGGSWREVASKIEGYFESYQGYLSSHEDTRADDAHLAEVAARVRRAEPSASRP